MRNVKGLAAGAVLVGVAWAAAAPAAAVAAGPTYPPAGPPTTQVEGTKVTRVPSSSPSASQLPFTGAQIVAYSVTGAGLVVAGSLLTLVRRRRNRGQTA